MSIYSKLVISREIRPLSALYPRAPASIQKVLYRAAISSFAPDLPLSGRQGRYAHACGICALFYCMSIKKKYGGGV